MKFIPNFFQVRSGSTVVGETLNQHPSICELGEVYCEVYSKSQRYTPSNMPLTMQNFLNFVEPNTYKLKGHSVGVFQFNYADMAIFDRELNHNKIFKFVGENFSSIIYTHRRNTLKRLVSYLKTKLADTKRHVRVDEINNTKRIHLSLQIQKNYLRIFSKHKIHNSYYYDLNTDTISLREFLNYCQQLEDEMFRSAKNNISNVIDIVYDDHIENNPLVAVNKITDSLGLKQYNDYRIPLQKIGKPLVDELQNYEEVYNHLEDTEFKWMLK